MMSALQFLLNIRNDSSVLDCRIIARHQAQVTNAISDPIPTSQ